MSSDCNSFRSAADAQAYLSAWNRAESETEIERLRALRQLTEEQAVQRFARLLVLTEPYPLRESSGLVEQQRYFSKLGNSDS